MRKIDKVWGFVLHFGYVESSRVGVLVLHHLGRGFPTVRAAARDLVHYFLEDYLDEVATPSLEDFQHYLREQPGRVASGGIGDQTFDGYHVNGERWWPWDHLHQMSRYFTAIYENHEEPAEYILPRFLDLQLLQDADFRAEVAEVQTPPTEEYRLVSWKKLGAESIFKPLLKGDHAVHRVRTSRGAGRKERRRGS